MWLCNPTDCKPPGSSIHGVLQARILECVANPFSRGSSQPRNQIWGSWIAGRFSTVWATITHTHRHTHTHTHTQNLFGITKLTEAHPIKKKKKKENRLNQNRPIIHPTREKSMGQGEVLEPEHTTLLWIQAIGVHRRKILNWVWCWNFKTN